MSKQRLLTLFTLFALLFAIALLLFSYYNYIENKKRVIEKSIYATEVSFIRKSAKSIIDEKKKATTAIALTLASNDALYTLSKNRPLLAQKIDTLIEKFRKNTDYKNIWFHIIDKEYKTLYASWKIEDEGVREEEFGLAIEKQKIFSMISVDSFGVSIKSIVPFYDSNDTIAGAVEVISHFNSVVERLKKLDINSVVIVDKKISKRIKEPFTKQFMDGCYIANFEIPAVVHSYVKEKGIENLCKEKYQIQDGYIIVAYPLKDVHNERLAYYVMFKKIVDVSKTDLQFFLFKGAVFILGLLLLLVIMVLVYFYLRTRKLKKYYKSIINSTTNILLICQGNKLISVNKIFFHYFKDYKTLAEFHKEHECICDFFVEESGYIQKYMDGIFWMEYIKKHPNFYHRAKLLIDGEVFYFSLSLSIISQESDRYSIILSDITEQELYKQELEHLTLSDPLTHVGNRRKYIQRLEEEISRACRYDTPLSLIIFDLDHFKLVNDRHGHTVGDEVLQEYSRLIATHLRDIDEIFRIGGEEFVIIAPHTALEDAVILAEKLRKIIESSKKVVPVTASFGVSEYRVGEDKEEFFTRADKALYEAKTNGRNRVVAL